MLNCINNSPDLDNQIEDSFSKCLLNNKNKNLPKNKDVQNFANDNGWSNYEKPFGIHKIWSKGNIDSNEYENIKNFQK